MENQVETIKYPTEKAKQNALAKLDLIRKWQEFRRKAVNKLQADYDFVKLHNSSDSYLFNVLGKISRGSLHRWKASLDGTEDYTRLIPNYKYVSVNEYRTCLTDEEIKIFMSLLLHPNRICIGKAIALTKYKLKEQGQSFIPADNLGVMQNGLRTTITTNGCLLETVKRLFLTKSNRTLKEMQACLMSEIF